MFQVKRFKQFDDLLLEADIIRFEDDFADINRNYREGDTTDHADDTDANKPAWDKLDALLDDLLDRGIVDLAEELKRPLYQREFGSDKGMQITEAYLEYCRERIKRLSTELEQEVAKPEGDKKKIEHLSLERIRVAARIEVLEKIFGAFKLLNQEDMTAIADDILQKVSQIKTEVASDFATTITAIAKVVQPELSAMKDSDTPQEEKEARAAKVIDSLLTLEKILPFYSPEEQDAAKVAKQRVEQTVKEAIGEERFKTIYKTILANDQEVEILKRILNLRHQNFVSEEAILKEVDGIKISINGLEGTKYGVPISKPEVIAYLKKTLEEEAAYVIGRAREKTITLQGAKGIHYDFNTKLKLYETVDLPVTGKQIADATWVMKLRKRFMFLIDLMPKGSLPVTDAGMAWADFGKQTHKAYAVTLNSVGKFIGKLIKGREGEMKGDALTRLFIPATEVLDGPNPIIEDVAPGLAMQVPGSVGTMGPITPATQDSVGSGDKFSPEKKKKKKKSVFEERMEIMNFSAFISKK